MANRLIKVRPVSASTNTPDAGAGSAQIISIPINGLTDGSGIGGNNSDDIYIADYANHVIYKYRKGAEASRILAGAYGVSGSADGQGAAARFNAPRALYVDRRGTIWIIDSGNNLIRRMTENGDVYTVAAIPAEVGGAPGHIYVDAAENIFLIDNTP